MAFGRVVLRLALGVLIPGLVTAIAYLVRTQYDFPFIFLYMPALLFVAYLGGLLAGLTGAIASTVLVDYFFVGPPGLSLQEAQIDALPSVLFLVSGIMIAAAGDQYRRYQARLRSDLVRSQRRERHERLVSEMMLELARPQMLEDLLQAIARRCSDILGDWCGIHVVESDGSVLRLGGLHHRDPERDRRLRQIFDASPPSRDHPLIEQLLGGPGPFALYPDDPPVRDAMTQIPAFEEVFARLSVWGLIAVPINYRGEALGLFSIGADSPRHWDADDLRLAGLMAERTGAAIQNARLLEARTRAERRVAIQYHVSRILTESGDLDQALAATLREIGDALGWAWAASWLVDESAGVLRCNHTWHHPSAAVEMDAISKTMTFERGVGLPGRIWASREPAWIRDVMLDANFPRATFAAKDGLHGAFGFPILIGNKVVGVLEFLHARILPPDETLLRTAAAIGAQIGESIERRRVQAAVRDSEARKSAILDTAMDCIITMDHKGHIIEFNPAAERTFGYTRDDVIGKGMATLIIPPSLREQHRRGLARYLATGEGPVIGRRIEMNGMRADGTEFPVDLSIVRIPSDGPPLFTGTLRDISERKQADDAQRLLGEATAVLSGSLDYEATLGKVARMAVPMLADWCAIEVVAEDHSVRQIAMVHSDPAKVAKAHQLQRRYPRDPNTHPISRVLHTGKAEFVSDIPESLMESLATDPEHLQAIREVGARSYMILPLMVGEKILGVMSLVRSESIRRYDERDLAVGEELARRAALAIDNAQRYQAEHAALAEAEREARRTQAVNRIIAIAAKALDVGEVFDEFAEALQLLIPYTWVTVTLADSERDVLVTPYVKGPANLQAPLEAPRAGTAPGWVLEHRRPLVRRDALDESEFREDQQAGPSGVRSYVIVPMTVAGEPIGTLNFGHSEPGFYKDEHARLVQPIADQLAITISRFRLFDEVSRRAGELSEMFQRALLPLDLPKAPFLAIAAHYRPADPEANIGGDWYDAALLPDDRVLLSIGDVAGHGLAAAAATGQVRNVIRAYAIEDRTPAQILTAANRFLSTLADTPHLSVWVGVLDPLTGDLTYASAGHPPPYLIVNGRADALAVGGTILGIASTIEYTGAQAILPPGGRLVAYTDGLIEGTRDVLEGEQRLQSGAVATAGESPERAIQGIVERSVEGTRLQDDIALIIVDNLPADAPLFFSVPALPESLRRVRRAVRAFAERGGMGARVEEVVMAVGEAALNVVEHAYSGRHGNLAVQGERVDGELVVTVRDFGLWRAHVERGRGRGVRIMKGFADTMRTQTGPGGTTVELRWSLKPTAAAC